MPGLVLLCLIEIGGCHSCATLRKTRRGTDRAAIDRRCCKFFVAERHEVRKGHTAIFHTDVSLQKKKNI